MAQSIRYDINGDPLLYTDAMSTPEAPKWQTAMEDEHKSLMEHKVWTLVDLLEGRKTIPCRWRYVMKRDTDNRPIRYKARLVAKGYSQTYGIDYDETFTPVARHDTLRLLLALTASFDLEVHQIDIKTAFLHGVLEEEIYMDQPEGFIKTEQEDKVCRLWKALYGLKQAPRQWYKRLCVSMKNWGFSEHLSGDVATFIKIEDDGSITIIVIYVDDLSIFASTITLINNFKKQVATEYQFVDTGEISHILGLRVIQDRERRTISIDQQHYIEKITERFDLENSPPSKTPMKPTLTLTASQAPATNMELQKRYQSMVGSLMYAMLGSRPDICFAVSKLSQFGSNPDQNHMAAAIRVFQYLKTTATLRLTYNGTNRSELLGWCDADWASDPDTCRSTTGYIFQVNSGAVAWGTRKQRTVALSSTEAEYMALTEVLKHTLWTLQVLRNLRFDCDLPITIFDDSKGARDISANSVEHQRTKHIDIRYHFIREKVQDKTIELTEVKSSENIADIFTKALPEPAHVTFTRKLGLIGASSKGEC